MQRYNFFLIYYELLQIRFFTSKGFHEGHKEKNQKAVKMNSRCSFHLSPFTKKSIIRNWKCKKNVPLQN